MKNLTNVEMKGVAAGQPDVEGLACLIAWSVSFAVVYSVISGVSYAVTPDAGNGIVDADFKRQARIDGYHSYPAIALTR